jgi:pimeloyl-ACP methyl ester carboxylesterase
MPTARRLRPERTVWVPDLAGFGRSEKPSTVLDVPEHAMLAARWLDSVTSAPVAVVGNSFGCQVAAELACRRPDLVAALVLIGPTVDPRAATMPRQIWRWLADLLREDWRQSRILGVDLRDAGARRIVTTLRHSIRDRITDKLPGISAATLMVRGAGDTIAPQQWLLQATALLPGARSLVLDGAAHNAVTTAGPDLATAIDAFLATTGPPGGRPCRGSPAGPLV